MRVVLDTTLCDKVCQSCATGRLFSQGTRNIVESGVKLHNPSHTRKQYMYDL